MELHKINNKQKKKTGKAITWLMNANSLDDNWFVLENGFHEKKKMEELLPV